MYFSNVKLHLINLLFHYLDNVHRIIVSLFARLIIIRTIYLKPSISQFLFFTQQAQHFQQSKFSLLVFLYLSYDIFFFILHVNFLALPNKLIGFAIRICKILKK